MESNSQLTNLSVSTLILVSILSGRSDIGTKTNEKLTALLARNVAIAELRKYVQDHPLIYTTSFLLDPLNIIIDKMIVSYMMSGKSKEETKNAIDELLRGASFYELEADVKTQIK